MKQHLTKQNIIRLAVAVVFLALFAWAIAWANSGWNRDEITDTTGVEYETARVLEILEDNTVKDETIEGRRRGSQLLELELITGRYAGDVTQCKNYFSAMYSVDVEPGQTVSVRVDTSGVNTYSVSIYNYNRIPLIIGIALAFALALILIGGWQGARALLGLIFTFICIMYLLLPLALRGWPTVPLTVAVVGVTSTVGFYLLGGWQPKTVGSILGCLCGVAAAALLGSLAIELLHVTAYQMDEAEGLLLARNDTGLQMKGLLLSGILIAAEGAVMDTSMSVASAMAELKDKRPDIGKKELFLSGMRIGRDTTGTMANTLVLAFAGSSLNMMVLIYSYQVSFNQLMNTDFVAVELVRAVAGSMGIILTVPCVAAICAWLLTRRGKAK
jgi:uncharacterized membrane protein